MTTHIPTIDETVTVAIGVLGSADSAIGSAHVHVDLDPDGDPDESSRAVGEAMSAAYMSALTDAMREFQPRLIEHFRDQRIRAQDESVE